MRGRRYGTLLPVIGCLLTLLLGCATSRQLGQGDQLARKGDYQGAINAYLLAARQHPGTPLARDAALRTGMLYERYLDRPDDAAHVYRNLARDNTGTAQAEDALWRLGKLYQRQKEYAKALPAFVQLILDAPQGKWVEQAQMERILCLAEMGQLQEALGLSQEFTRYYPDSDQLPRLLLGQARIHEDLEQREPAVALYRQIARGYPGTPEADEAQKHLEQLNAVVAESTPTDEGGLRDVGPKTRPDARNLLYSWGPSEIFGVSVKDLILGGEGLFGGEELQESLAGDGALLDDAVYNMGLMFAMTGEYRKAGACLERALELGLSEPDLYLQLGIAYREVGAIDAAARTFAELYQRDPRAVQRLLEQADRYDAQGEFENAQKYYRSLRGISPEIDAHIADRMGTMDR